MTNEKLAQTVPGPQWILDKKQEPPECSCNSEPSCSLLPLPCLESSSKMPWSPAHWDPDRCDL